MPSSVMGNNLKALMDKKNLTVKSLEAISGVSEATITRIRTGRSPNTSTATINALCLALECTAAELIGEEAAAHIATDMEAALMAQQEAYERQITSDALHHREMVDELRAGRDRAKKRANTWMIVAIVAMLSFTATAAAFYRFHWDVTHPHVGNIQYETLSEFKEALGIEE